MDKADIAKIKQYCDRATPGPWKRSLVRDKCVTVNTDKPPHKWQNIVCFNSGSHIQDWYNFQFISRARQDLPQLVRHCAELAQLLELTNRQLELERANKRLEVGIARLHLRRVNEKKLRLKGEHHQLVGEKEKLELEKKQKDLQLKLINKQLELERSIKQLEVQRTQKQLQMERAQKLELFDREYGYYRGECDKYLDELDRVEAAFKGKDEEMRLAHGYTGNDPVTKARKMVVPRESAPTLPQPQENAEHQPKAAAPPAPEIPEKTAVYQDQIMALAQQLHARADESYNLHRAQNAAGQPAAESIETYQEQENDMNPEQIQEQQRRLGLDEAQHAVESYISSDHEEPNVSLDELLDELDRTEASLNEWSMENVENYGRFGENVARAAQAAKEFLRPADNFRQIAESEPGDTPQASQEFEQPAAPTHETAAAE